MKRVIHLVLICLLCLSLNNCADSGSGSGCYAGTACIDEFSFDASSNTALDRTVSCAISGTAISCKVPFGTDVTALVATFNTTGESVTVGENNQKSGATANDFTSPVTYAVTASDADGKTQDYQDYTVTVTVLSSNSTSLSDAKEITAYSFTAATNTALSTDVTATISGTDITATVPSGVAVTALVATFTTTGSSVSIGGTIQKSGETANDFTGSVTYTVTAEDGTTRDYTVSVSTSQSQLSMEAFIKADNNDVGDNFSYSAVSLDGDTLAVGAWLEDSNQTTITSSGSADNSNDSSGAVYVYTRSGTDWSMQAFIKADNNDADDRFGISVSLDGDTLAVGASDEDSNQTTITASGSTDNSSSNSGAVYVYTRSGTDWSMQAYIKADNNDADDEFGGESISLDGDTLAVGAMREDSNLTTITTSGSADNSNVSSGAVYVYTRSGTNWSMQAYIKADNNDSSVQYDYFGNAVSLDGDTLAVGAFYEDSNQTTITSSGSADNSNSRSGAVYVYTRSGTDWSMQAYIKADNNDVDDYFGNSVSLDGDTLAVGALFEDSNQTTITPSGSADNSKDKTGAVYVYTRSGTDWSMQAYIKADNNDDVDYYSGSISLDGDTLAVGANYEDSDQTTITSSGSADNSNSNSGAVYVYTRSGTDWSMRSYIKADNNDANDVFGQSVSLSGDTLAVGTRLERSDQTTITSSGSADNSSINSGAVYIYR